MPLNRLNELRRAGELPLVLRGRRFTYRGLRTIIGCAAEHYTQGRTKISQVVCRRLNWRQPNGWLKERACRDVLRQLERLKLFSLPRPLDGGNSKRRTARQAAKDYRIPRGTLKEISQMPQTLELVLAKGNDQELLWNALVEKHHYLGYGVQVGRCLKYLVKGDGQLIGAISFSSPAWKLAVRDSLMKELGFATHLESHDVVINNSRFLILPKVRVPHLASRVLAAATRQAFADWSWYYNIEPLLAETFVEPRRYEGTCYRAANWIEIGTTSGYAKVGASHHNSQRPKTLFIYGLTRSCRRHLPEVLSALGLHQIAMP